jgi:hypothetical protein
MIGPLPHYGDWEFDFYTKTKASASGNYANSTHLTLRLIWRYPKGSIWTPCWRRYHLDNTMIFAHTYPMSDLLTMVLAHTPQTS